MLAQTAAYRLFSILLILAAALAGCVRPAQVTLTTHSSFDKETAEKQMQPGKNTIKGSSLLRQQGGGVVTCAGTDVALIPYSNYARERMISLYLNDNGGFDPIVVDHSGFLSQDVVQRKISTPADPEYKILQKKAQCDAQGYFSFTNLADGDYYIVTFIVWGGRPDLGLGRQGGALMKKVHVEGGETKEVVINGNP